ncbi:MAG: TIGR03936 family radical SAM-associated protein [Gemmataceae bacterium]|nr:TIGR03936 family radical SAM-associated protein [Gemmataceae bacterium]
MTGDKIRLRFAKTGTLRLLSHHDLMRTVERMLRRAGLPFKSTAGFNPGPRLVFALSLPLGADGLDEVVELELTRPMEAADVLAGLNAQAPAGLAFTRVAVVPMKATAVPRRVEYRLTVPDDRIPALADRAAGLMTADKVWVERTRPTPKRLNIRPYLRALWVEDPTPPPSPLPRRGRGDQTTVSHTATDPDSGVDASALFPLPPRGRGLGGGVFSELTLDLWVTQTGTARADELLRLLGADDLLDAGAVLARTRVEIRDEVPPDQPDGPPDGPADTLPLEPAAAAAAAARETLNQPAAADWGLSPSGPVVE